MDRYLVVLWQENTAYEHMGKEYPGKGIAIIDDPSELIIENLVKSGAFLYKQSINIYSGEPEWIPVTDSNEGLSIIDIVGNRYDFLKMISDATLIQSLTEIVNSLSGNRHLSEQ